MLFVTSPEAQYIAQFNASPGDVTTFLIPIGALQALLPDVARATGAAALAPPTGLLLLDGSTHHIWLRRSGGHKRVGASKTTIKKTSTQAATNHSNSGLKSAPFKGQPNG